MTIVYQTDRYKPSKNRIVYYEKEVAEVSPG